MQSSQMSNGVTEDGARMQLASPHCGNRYFCLDLELIDHKIYSLLTRYLLDALVLCLACVSRVLKFPTLPGSHFSSCFPTMPFLVQIHLSLHHPIDWLFPQAWLPPMLCGVGGEQSSADPSPTSLLCEPRSVPAQPCTLETSLVGTYFSR